MRFDEYRQLDAVEIADHVRRGDVSPVELLECAHARYKAVNNQINAIINPMFFNASRYLHQHKPEGALAGVPMVLKDLQAHFAGVPTSGGSLSSRYVMQTQSSTLVKRLCDEGAIIVGKTNTPEFGLLATTENSAFGVTRNPWHLDRSTGGSSGGTAAAVSAGIVPIGSAGDGGGSIRIPAACCGLFGLKPTRGLVPCGPELGESWDGATCEHVLTRSVRDSALVLDIVAGADAYSHTPAQAFTPHFHHHFRASPGRLKIAFSCKSPLGGSVSASCQAAVEHAATLLRNIGHDVEEAAPVLAADDIVKSYSDIYIAHVTAEVDHLCQLYGSRYARSGVEPLSYFISRMGQRFSAGAYTLSRQRWVHLQGVMATFHQQYDLWLTPVMAAPPYPLGEQYSSRMEQRLAKLAALSGLHRLIPIDVLYQISAKQLQKVPFTQIANLTGQPAMSVPLYWDQDNLPVGVQMVGKAGNDLQLLQVAYQLEEAQPWFHRVPPL